MFEGRCKEFRGHQTVGKDVCTWQVEGGRGQLLELDNSQSDSLSAQLETGVK